MGWSSRGGVGDGTWTVSDSQGGCFSDSVSLTVLGNFSWFWAVSGVSSDNFSDNSVVRESCDSRTC